MNGLSPIQVDNHILFYNTYISVDVAHIEIHHVKCGTVGMKIDGYMDIVGHDGVLHAYLFFF